MIRRVQTLPPEVVRIADWGGEAGRRWVAGLPERLALLSAAWELTLGVPFTDGYCSYATPVTRADGSSAVLKVPFVDEENYAEARALQTYDGDGAVQLLNYHADTGAMLLERAEPGSSLKAYPGRTEALEIACALLTRLRRPLAPAVGHVAEIPDPPKGAQMAAGIAATLRAAPSGAVPAEVLAAAIGWADRLASAPAGPELLVNRDAHLDNIRAARREPWLLIDPKPLVGEAALDGGWLLLDLLTDGPTRTLADEWAPRVAAGLDLDETRVRGWALIRAMENAAFEAARGNDPSEDLAFADAVAPPP